MSTRREDLFNGVSGLTSATALVADAAELTVQPLIASETSLEVWGSNADGFSSALAEGDWSVLTTLVSLSANDMYNIEPGFRWLRVVRESAASATAVNINMRNVVRGMG